LCACSGADVDHWRAWICTAAIAVVRGNSYVASASPDEHDERIRFDTRDPLPRSPSVAFGISCGQAPLHRFDGRLTSSQVVVGMSMR
jgi:hypothetical protein